MFSFTSNMKNTKTKMFTITLYWWILFLDILQFLIDEAHGTGTKCYRNEIFGDREGNVYYCESEDLPECCEQNSEFTCCENNKSKALREQFILFGTVIGVVVFMAVLICCIFKEYQCFSSDVPLLQRCGCKKATEDSDTDSVITNEHPPGRRLRGAFKGYK